MKTNSAKSGTSGKHSGNTSELGVFLKPHQAQQEELEQGPEVYKPHPGAMKQHSG